MLEMSRRIALVGLLAVAVCATAGPGYLPTAGPAALRFERPPPPPAGAPMILMPLPVIEPRATVPSGEPTPPTASSSSMATTNSNPPLGLLDPNIILLTPEASSTNSVTDPAPESEFIAPQMFMKYFTGRPGTNSTGASVFTPVGFVPPLPVAPPSSSATFQTTPPGKP